MIIKLDLVEWANMAMISWRITGLCHWHNRQGFGAGAADI
jgi:hypothetical protein